MASILQTRSLELSQIAKLGNIEAPYTRNLHKSSFSPKAPSFSSQIADCKLLLSSKRSKAKQTRLSKFSTLSVATSDANVSTEDKQEIGLDERRKAAEQQSAAKPYRIQEAETTGQQEFNPATVTVVNQVAPNARCITIDAEVSREFVGLDNAYAKIGQTVKIKLQSGEVVKSFVSSPPFPSEYNAQVLLKLRGDIPAGTTKVPQFSLSVKAPLDLHVTDSSPLYNLQSGDEISVGPFEGGLDLRPISFLSRFPTLLIFANDEGVSTARAILEASDIGSLCLNMRQDVRLYYSAETPSALAYKDLHGGWAKKVNFRPTVDSSAGEEWNGFVGSFAQLFDEDDLEYDPLTTAAVVCVRAADKDKVIDLLNDAGIDLKNVLFSDL